MIKLAKTTREKLDSIARVHERIKALRSKGDKAGADKLVTPAYHHYRAELSQEFLPLLTSLVEAHLISLSLNVDSQRFTSGDVLDGEALSVEYSTMTFGLDFTGIVTRSFNNNTGDIFTYELVDPV